MITPKPIRLVEILSPWSVTKIFILLSFGCGYIVCWGVVKMTFGYDNKPVGKDI